MTNNWNNTKNTWKGIKSILSIKPNPSDIPKILNTNDSTITNPVEIANVFNNYFSCIVLFLVVPVHEKDSKIDFSNYRPISLLSNLDKILEKIMYTRIFKFFSNNNLFYPLQFGFRQNYSTTHALISLTETIRKCLDERKFACGIFVDLEKAFDTVEHDIKHYGVRGLANHWFKSYLSHKKQFVSVNGHDSNPPPVLYGVTQGSVLIPLLFLIYINDLNQAIKFCKVHHFADDTNLHFGKSMIKLNKYVNLDMKNLTDWLNANKISLNVQKTELVIFKHQRKKLGGEIKIKLNRK